MSQLPEKKKPVEKPISLQDALRSAARQKELTDIGQITDSSQRLQALLNIASRFGVRVSGGEE